MVGPVILIILQIAKGLCDHGRVDEANIENISQSCQGVGYVVYNTLLTLPANVFAFNYRLNESLIMYYLQQIEGNC